MKGRERFLENMYLSSQQFACVPEKTQVLCEHWKQSSWISYRLINGVSKRCKFKLYLFWVSPILWESTIDSLVRMIAYVSSSADSRFFWDFFLYHHTQFHQTSEKYHYFLDSKELTFFSPSLLSGISPSFSFHSGVVPMMAWPYMRNGCFYPSDLIFCYSQEVFQLINS